MSDRPAASLIGRLIFAFVCDQIPRAEVRGYQDAAAPQPIAVAITVAFEIIQPYTDVEAIKHVCGSLRSSGG